MKRTLLTLLMASLLLEAGGEFAAGANGDFQERGAIGVDIAVYQPAIREFAVGVGERVFGVLKDAARLFSENIRYSTYPVAPYGPKGTGEKW